MCVPGTRSQASALYLLCYFLGSRIGGSAGCLAYSDAGWPGLVAMVSGLLVLIPAARLTLPSRTAGKDAGYTVVVPVP
jgi:YNFM family putative membrane transporter